MKRALALAGRGEGYVEPNPMVGCVIVRGGEIVGEGWHWRYGGPHAEIEALRQAGAAARGATVYVTLEPCPHHGKTPPCAEALVEAGAGRVVIGTADPVPGRGGAGIAKLRGAGIDVTVGVREAEARRVIEPFSHTARHGRPWVLLKWAATLDGATATATGHSQWITNERSRREVHQLRGRVDAVLVGIGTVLADDPRLTARGVKARRTARRVVIDPDLRLPTGSKLWRTAGETPVTTAVRQSVLDGGGAKVRAAEAAGMELIGLGESPDASSGLSLRPLLEALWARHRATRLLVEGGAATHGRFLLQGLANEILAFVAPRLLLDAGARGAVALPGDPWVPGGPGAWRTTMDEAAPAELRSVRRLGGDVLLRYQIADSNSI